MKILARLGFAFVAYSSASLAGRCPGQQAPAASPPSAPASPTTSRPDAPNQPAEAGKEKPSANERLEAVRKKYLELKTYRDEGVSDVVLDFGVEPKDSMRTTFTTAFERGGRFRWEGKSTPIMAPMQPGLNMKLPEDSYSIWSTDPKTHFSYWERTGKRKTEQTLAMALEGASGVTNGASSVVAMLLTSDERRSISSTIDFESPVEKEPEIVDGARCTVIEGLRKAGSNKPSDVRLWIDENSLIRRVQQTNYIDPARKGPGNSSPPRTVKVTVNIKPVIDGKIDDRSFEPPPAAK